MQRLTDTIQDIKEADPDGRKPLGIVYKILYTASLCAFAASLFYGGYKFIYTIVNSGKYQSCEAEIDTLKSTIKNIDHNIAKTGILYTFYEKQQEWLSSNYSSSKVWTDIFQSIPAYIGLNSAYLENTEEFKLIRVNYSKLRRSAPNPISEFSKNLESLGHIFELNREGFGKKGEHYFQGILKKK